jgi:hypothetical protein
MATQLSFFESPEQNDNTVEVSRVDAIHKVAWSYSKRTTFEQCTRKYYYEYFGGNKRKAKDDQNKEDIIALKQLQNRYERVGKILHFVIGNYLRNSKTGNIRNPSRLKNWATEIFEKDISYSSDPSSMDVSQDKYPPALLAEFHYQLPDALELCQKAQDRLIHALDTFLNSSALRPFREAGSQTDAIVEKPFTITENLACKAEGRIDLAYFSENKFTIVDWKLGEEDNAGDDSLQLAVYALWAVQTYGYDANSIRVCKVFLGSENIVDFECTDEVLAVARARILQDAERMLLLEKYGKDANMIAFTPSAQQAVCKLCPYLNVCPEGKESTYA